MNKTWAIILAAGDGARLRSLVRLIHDEALPKQFATLVGSRSLLQATIERVGAVVPPHRMTVVVDRSREEIARQQLADWRDIEIVSQPKNLGTGYGVLLPLARLRRRDPDASVAIFPSDHYVPRPASYLDGVRVSLEATGVTLLGVVPERPDPDLGWIVPALPVAGRVQTVRRFVEKPDLAEAEKLFRRGALWNTFVISGRLRDLWELTATHLPIEAAAFEGAVRSSAIDGLYRRKCSVDFSRAVLEKAFDLQVTRVAGSGWADLGTPERVIQSLDGTPALDMLLRRIIAGQQRGGGMTLSLAARVTAAIQANSQSGRYLGQGS